MLKCSGTQPCSTCKALYSACVYSARGLDEQNGKTRNHSLAYSSSNSTNSMSRSNSFASLQQFISTIKSPVNGVDIPLVIKGDDALYQNDEEFQAKINTLHSSLNRLKSGTRQSSNITRLINQIERHLDDLITKWQPKINQEKLSRAQEKDSRSYETLLLKNKYTDKIHLTRYAIFSGSSSTFQSQNNKNNPLVDEMFGLYSPFQLFSFQGIGYSCQEFLKKSKLETISKEAKELIYLILRLFDMVFAHISEGKISVVHPLENYFKSKKINLPSNDMGLTYSSESNGGAFETKSLVTYLLNELPENFIQASSGIPLKSLLEMLGDNFAMFKIILNMYYALRTEFDKFMVDMTSTLKSSPTYVFSSEENERLLMYLKQEEIIKTLSYTYFNCTLYTFFSSLGNFDYLEELLRFISIKAWSRDHFSMGPILEFAIDKAIQTGLSRWEFYVGLDEEVAERRRKIWWSLFCKEKRLALKLGSPSKVNDSLVNCLLPKCFRDAGFLDSREFLENVNHVSRNSVFDSMDITNLAMYGEAASLLISSRCSEDILFSERYTSIRNSSQPPLVKIKLFEEIIVKVNEVKCQLLAVKNQTSRLLDIVLSSNQSVQELLPREEFDAAVSTTLLYEYIFVRIVSSVDNLEARLASKPYTQFQSAYVQNSYNEILASWRKMSSMLLNIKDNYTCSKFFFIYCTATVLVMNKSIDLSEKMTVEDIFSLLRICDKFRGFRIFTSNEQEKQISESVFFKEFCRSVSCIVLAARLAVLRYCKANKFAAETLIKEFQDRWPELAVVPGEVMNTKSKAYKYLLKPVEQSGFHLKVRKMLEANFNDSKNLEQKNHSESVGQLSSPNEDIALKDTKSNKGNAARTISSTRSASFNPSIDCLMNSNTNENTGFESDATYQAQEKMNPLELNTDFSSFNLGTLDEFVNTDMESLYNVLWSDLYPDAF
ncbi:hypothetical protein KAFR_0F03400 [Kazachstania africana CBS 2517]|uniref:Xylanolytic transcriptional activator regulatory domain-containing protein n=1 Tax=Kazachstania africana (strain ATCC 22294 / BCRC 22015 / CBS 2517 / CECT 1963 / NBRC 1671 / NRRL Y-8276) TaxID=1071382 RepID=H2AX36_KAZAF|nr:hypothetical protein KAFR_0F03400 [Kazachstania africana CBS 2517]CCF58936.1 hypothetical protein KAFR_0F03400 [Kazachstania africana CBS 2517]